MDRNEVKNHIENTIAFLNKLSNCIGGNYLGITYFLDAKDALQTALKELDKSDWISVKDELPPYEESVLVCNEGDPEDMWFCHRSNDPKVETREDGWCNYLGNPITHWCRVDKLEV